MILKVVKDFEYEGKKYYEGQLIKLGTRDFNNVNKDEVNVVIAEKFEKEVIVKQPSVVKQTKVVKKTK